MYKDIHDYTIVSTVTLSKHRYGSFLCPGLLLYDASATNDSEPSIMFVLFPLLYAKVAMGAVL